MDRPRARRRSESGAVLDSAGWRQLARLVELAFAGERESFVRMLVVLVVVASVGLAAIGLLGPTLVGGVGGGAMLLSAFRRRSSFWESSRQVRGSCPRCAGTAKAIPEMSRAVQGASSATQ
ncbi:hypothetical protein [Amycolatopsis sp. cg9]|uniref:hypothetical protein n=1 Tax=Amycolatopsis sp. cg9 TaxID=3238801 RepID=UPI0035266CEF